MTVTRRGEMPIAKVAKDFGITESCLCHWLAQHDVETGSRPGVTRTENEVLRQAAPYLSQANMKLGKSPQ